MKVYRSGHLHKIEGKENCILSKWIKNILKLLSEFNFIKQTSSYVCYELGKSNLNEP